MPPVIAIVGRPNVGKSTLFNRMSRSRDALVDDMPGVTRDRLYTTIVHDQAALTLVDTGGFDDADADIMTVKVREQVERAMEEADAVIFVVDGREGVMPGDEEVVELLRRSDKKTFLAVNKVDGPEHDSLALDFYKFGLDSVNPVSAAHGYGVKTLLDRIVSELPVDSADLEEEHRIRVAILGRPNVGKSSLINRILGLERLLVSDLPGTTRDSVDLPFVFRGREYLLIDTAGLRRKARVKERIEKFSMIKSLGSIRRCHVAVILLDASEGILEQDARICGYAADRSRAIVLAVNKWDLVKGNRRKQEFLERTMERRLKFIPYAPRINLSALTGERVSRLFNKIELVHGQFDKMISTPALNKALGAMIRQHPPPRLGRGKLRFFYAAQTGTRPPSFVIFVNRPDMIHFSYKRFLANRMRSMFELESSPIRLMFREREKRKHKNENKR